MQIASNLGDQKPIWREKKQTKKNKKKPYSVYFATVNFLPLRSNFEEHCVRRRPRCGMMNGPGFVGTSGKETAPKKGNCVQYENYLLSKKFRAYQTLPKRCIFCISTGIKECDAVKKCAVREYRNAVQRKSSGLQEIPCTPNIAKKVYILHLYRNKIV